MAGQGRSGSSVTLPGVSVERDYGWIRFSPSSQADATPQFHAAEGAYPSTGLTLTVPSILHWPLTGQLIRASLGGAMAECTVPTPALTGHIAIFDADLVTLPLLVRSWMAGDLFYPAGMQGKKKKLQDYFTDIKLPRHERARVPLLVAPEGILWVGGYRADHRFHATTGTARTLTIELLDDQSE